MYESGTFLDYEIAYRRERMLDAAGHNHKARHVRRPWSTRPLGRHQR